MATEERMQIRSYRVCFDLERRIHKIDRWRVPLPYGVPLRGLAYAGALLVAVLVLSTLPIAGQLLGLVHPALRFAILPIGGAALLTRWSLDGRPAHRVAAAWLRHSLRPARTVALRPSPPPGAAVFGEVPTAWDERSSGMRRGLVEGPARVVLRYPVQSRARAKTLRVSQDGGEAQWRGTQVELRDGQRMVVG